jgi:hypothetical protein
MKSIMLVMVGLVSLFLSISIFANPNINVGHGKAGINVKGSSLPPGLQDKAYPRGLDINDKRPHGWSQGEKRGWYKVHRGEHYNINRQKHINKIKLNKGL